MPRKSTPWYHAAKGAWRVHYKGRCPILLYGPNDESARGQAMRAFADLVESRLQPAEAAEHTVDSIIAEYRRHLKAAVAADEKSDRTLEDYAFYLSSFCVACGDLSLEILKPFHVARWLEGRTTWGAKTRRNAMAAVKACFNWAESQGFIELNPVRKLVLPPKPVGRRRILSSDERTRISDAIKPGDQFRDFVRMIELQGCRPGEAASVEAADIDWKTGLAKLYNHKTLRKTGKPRVVYVVKEVAAMLKPLADKHPTGSLLLNRRGRPWNRNAWGLRFRRLRAKLGLTEDVVAYCLRHTFATNAIEDGNPLAAVSELLGHSDTRTTAIYTHIDQRHTYMREQAEKAAESAKRKRE